MDYEAIAAKVAGIPYMTRQQGRRIYEHIRTARPTTALEIGTANAVGTSYIAAALEANGEGHVTSLDRTGADYSPGPDKVLADTGLAHRVKLIRNPDSSYNWWLKKQILARMDPMGNIESIYDFVYLDGAHEWNIDGLAVVLIEKLLEPGGWLVLDDINWTYATSPSFIAKPSALPTNLSDEELTEPHVRAVFDLLLKSHPAFTELYDDGEWGWAKKDPEAPRRLTIVTETPARSVTIAQLLRGWLAPRVRTLRQRRKAV